MLRLSIVSGCALLLACQTAAPPAAHNVTPGHSSTLALDSASQRLYVVNPDADSVSEIDLQQRVLKREFLLAGDHPQLNAGAYTPAVMPRTLALSPDARTLYVTGQRAGRIFAIDLATGTIKPSDPVGAEPYALIISADGQSVYVTCAQDAQVVQLAAATLKVLKTTKVSDKPWALAWSGDGQKLWVTHFLGAQITSLDAQSLEIKDVLLIPEVQPRGDRRLAHGVARGLYDLAPRPGADELWLGHALLATDTAEPQLDFESTAFPALSVIREGVFGQTFSTDAPDVAGIDGAFSDVVSGPRALAFTNDGAYLLQLDVNSEDLLVFDATQQVENSLVRPLPGHMPTGIALSDDEKFVYVDEQNTNDIVVFKVDRTIGLQLTQDGPPISRLVADPMPGQMRLGQHLFYSANSDEFPITKNHWVACATCHMEGQSDAVTWRFVEGPRDTPSNAGGQLGTGFLMRTADRRTVQDYWRTINIEQGGKFDPTDPTQASQLEALAAYVNFAIPLPIPPTTDPVLVARGAKLFADPQVACATCHSGPRLTDSGAGNPTLDLAGPIVLHDVGTCATASFADVAHTADDGQPRAACQFDTPSLNGVAASAPYFHDGSAATLRDVLEMTRGKMGDISGLSADDENALIEYMRSL